MPDLETDCLLHARLNRVEEELTAVKVECKRLARVEDELKAIKNEFTTIKLEHAALQADRKDIKEQVDSLDHYLSECLEIIDTTAKKLQVVEESISDIQGKDANSNNTITLEVENVREATAGAHNRASSPEKFVDFGTVFVEKMDAIQAAVVKRMDSIEAVVQSKLHQYTKVSEQMNEPVEDKMDHAMLVNIEKKTEDVLEHSMAVVSCESKLEKLEKLFKFRESLLDSLAMTIKRIDVRGARQEERLDRFEQQITAIGKTNIDASLYQNEAGAVPGKGIDKLVALVSKLRVTIEAFDKTLRNTTLSDTTLQNILQWTQSINGKIVDLSGKIETQPGQKRGIDSLQKAISSLATKADLQFTAAAFQNTTPGKKTKKGGSRSGGSINNIGLQQPSTAKSDKPKPASTSHPSPASPSKLKPVNTPVQNAVVPDKPKLATMPVPSPACPSQAKSGLPIRANSPLQPATTPVPSPASFSVDAESSFQPNNRVSSMPFTLKTTTDLNTPSTSSTVKTTANPNTPTMASTSKTTANLIAQAIDFQMPGSLNSESELPFENWEDVVLPDMVHQENIESTQKFADSY